MFEAPAAGDVEVKLIQRDATTGTVIITNKTPRPRTIKLPEAFAGVAVLARRGRGGGGGGFGGIGRRRDNQSVGGGFGGGGGLFNVGPEQVVKLKITAVRLGHGKSEPNPRIPYELIPIECSIANADVIEVVMLLGRGGIGQADAQAAAWYVADGLSWEQLARKTGIKHLNGTSEPFFSSGELEKAMQVVQEARRRAAWNERPIQSSNEASPATGN